MRLIDADALKDKFRGTNANGINLELDRYAIKCIDDAPTIVQERKGRWIKENIVLTSNPPQFQWHCSECGRIKHWFTSEVLTEYCPHCGAHMEGAEE